MTSRSTGSSASRAGIFAVVALLVQVMAVALHSATAAAQHELGPNIIVTSDAPGIRQQGGFQQIKTRLSHSAAPLRSVGASAHSVTFTTSIAQPGFYRVFVWWPQVYDNVGAVDVVVEHLRGTSVVTTAQGARTGQWVPIDIYEFGSANGAEIRLRGNPGDTLLADAVRFQYMGSAIPALAFETDALPVASTGETYSASFDLIAGTPPYAFDVDRQHLPPGMVLDSVTGTLTGTATTIGSYPFDMTVSDSTGQRAVRAYTIDVFRGSSVVAGRVRIARDAARMQPLDGVPAGTPPDLSNLITVLAGLPEGEWYKANLNAFSDVWTPVDLRPEVGLGNPTPYKLIQAWSSFAWDPNRGQLWLYGGGHANYSGNDVYRWRGATQRWERASLPSEIKQDDLGNWQAIDGWDAAPASAHTYDNNMFFPHIDRLVVFGGAAYDNGSYFRREVTPTTSRATGPFFFDPARADPNKVGGTTGSHVMRVAPHPEIVGGNMWANRDIYLNIPGTPPLDHVSGCTAYGDENGKDVAYIGAHFNGSSQLNLFKYTVNDLATPVLDTLQQIGIYWSGTSGNTACGVDPVRHLLARIGSQTIPFVYWNLATPGLTNKDVLVTPIDPTGEFGTLLSNNQIWLQLCALDFDPTRGRFTLWCGDGRVWALTPPPTASPNGWTIVKQPSPSLAVPNGDVGTGLLGKWKYVPNLDAFIGLQDSTLGNIWIYKPVGWINPAGTSLNPPAGVAASDGMSTSSVTVSWNASANATSYTIFRSLSGGVQGSAIGSTAATSFVDATATRGTVYYYGVTATGPSGVSALSVQDSGYVATSDSGGSLSGAATMSSIVNLTAVGTADWVHWLPLNRKAGGGMISDFVPVGTGTVATYFNDPRSFVWTDGTPNLTGNDSAGATTAGIGAGFRFTVAAGTTTRTLVVYVGGTNSSGTLTAHLSDASAADYVDSSLSGTGRYDGFYTIVFKASRAGQQLTISWTQRAGSGSMALQGAALH